VSDGTYAIIGRAALSVASAGAATLAGVVR